jgi:hypothetical protein
MTISWLDFFAVTLAAGAIIEVWHKGSLFETARAYAQALQDVTPHNTAKGLFLELVNCPLCKSYHVPLYLFLLLLAGDWVGGVLQILCRVVIYSLGATRLGNVIDSLLPKNSQYIPQ